MPDNSARTYMHVGAPPPADLHRRQMRERARVRLIIRAASKRPDKTWLLFLAAALVVVVAVWG